VLQESPSQQEEKNRSGAGYAPAGSIGAPLDEPGIVLLLEAAVLSSDAELAQDAGGRWCVTGDSTE